MRRGVCPEVVLASGTFTLLFAFSQIFEFSIDDKDSIRDLAKKKRRKYLCPMILSHFEDLGLEREKLS